MEEQGRKKADDRPASIRGSAPVTRRLSSWLDGFEQYLDKVSSPKVFRKWGGIACLAGALERKVWVYTNMSNLYPNLYTVLVGPPGAGKTVVTSTIQSLWSELPDHKIAATTVSRASLIDDLREAERRIVMPNQNPPVVTFNSLLIAVNELGVFMPGYDNEFMSTLTDLYDNKRYAERKRTKDLNFTISAPQLNILSATTPSYLHSVMPEGAWDQGFISRVLLIYSGENVPTSLFSETSMSSKLYSDLVHDLKIIGDKFGRVKFTESAAAAIDAWHMSKGSPAPEHPKLQHYNSRRTAHVLKLSMIANMDTRGDFIITLEDFHRALDWLLEAEKFMPDIFKSSASGGDAGAIDDLFYYVRQYFVKTGKNVPEAKLIEFLQSRVPSHNIERIISIMCKANLIEKMLDGYRPRVKKDQ